MDRHRPDTRRLGSAFFSPVRLCLAGFLCLLTLPAASPAPSGLKPIKLTLPIDCSLGKDCFIQNYVDMDPGGDAKDFTCGPLAYNNHQGTDFRLRNREALKRPYSALATAPGRWFR